MLFYFIQVKIQRILRNASSDRLILHNSIPHMFTNYVRLPTDHWSSKKYYIFVAPYSGWVSKGVICFQHQKSFFNFHRGDPYDFSHISSKISKVFFFRKIIRVPPMKIEKKFYPNWAGMCSYDHISST